jgi:hypothetical protein
MKKNRAVIFAAFTILTIGIVNYSEFERKANATDQSVSTKDLPANSAPSTQEIESDTEDVDAINQTSSVGQGQEQKTDTHAKPVNNQLNQQESTSKVEAIQTQKKMPETKVLDGYTYVNLMDRSDENLKHLVDIAEKHDATLYAIEFSDCFAMFDQMSDQPFMVFSTGNNSVSIDHVDVLYDMHPSIKERIKDVVETGKETLVEVGEYESYHISKAENRIKLSY